MKVLKQSGNLQGKDLHKVLVRENATGMKECEGQIVEVKAWCLTEESDNEMLTILTPEDELIVTNSNSFIRGFEAASISFGKIESFKVGSKPSTYGNSYITCDSVEEA